MKQPTKVLFVCLGNICRSPLAEGVFRHLVQAASLEKQFEIASAGTGNWHVGNPPDRRMVATARNHGIDLSKQRAQQFKPHFLETYDLILAMDGQNYETILSIAGTSGALDPSDLQKVKMYRSFDPTPDDGHVPDPYYGDAQDFEACYQIVARTAKALLKDLSQ